MSVEGVNSVNLNNNNILIATGTGAVIGAGAGVASAVMSKPYLSGVLPSDKFILKSVDNMAKSSNEDIKSLGTILKDSINTVKTASTHEDLLKLVDMPMEKILAEVPDEMFEKLLLKGKAVLESAGEKIPAELKSVLDNISTKQDLASIGKGMLHNAIADIPVQDIKTMGKDIGRFGSSMILSLSQTLKDGACHLTDSEKAIQDAIKSAASSITKMSALKLGGIGAVAAGGIGFAASVLAGKENKVADNKNIA